MVHLGGDPPRFPLAAQLLAGIGVFGVISQVVQRGAVAAGQVHDGEQLTINVSPLGGNAVRPHIVATAVAANQVEPCSCHADFREVSGLTPDQHFAQLAGQH